MQSSDRCHFLDALKLSNVRFYIGAVGFFTLASRALVVVIGFQIYQITRSTLALGLLGLVEAVPVISLVLFGGYVADHFNRKKILLITGAVSCFCGLALAFLSWESHHSVSVLGLYGVIFMAGIARGFADPASTAFETQVIPKHLTVSGGSWISSTWISCSIIGPAAIGFIFAAGGAIASYLVIACCFVISWFCTWAIQPAPQVIQEKTESIFKSIGTGWKFVFSNQPLLGALALDLFAVLFGGAMALLPVYANDILHVGVKGLGLLNAAPALGALIITLLATHKPPIKNAGRNLLLTVTGFGISILVFAFSKHFFLSLAALFFSGLFDGISVVIRRAMIRLLSPEHLRGRVAAASWIFICSSNELGALESGLLASLIGTVPCVAVGGVLTFIVVGLIALRAPQLRKLSFNLQTFEPSH
jgi:MFS family permease